jgi:hypothetical protein
MAIQYRAVHPSPQIAERFSRIPRFSLLLSVWLLKIHARLHPLTNPDYVFDAIFQWDMSVDNL